MLGSPGCLRNDLSGEELLGNSGSEGRLQPRSSSIPENAGGDITTTADGDHEVGMEAIEDLLSGGLAQLVHLSSPGILADRVRYGWLIEHGSCDCAVSCLRHQDRVMESACACTTADIMHNDAAEDVGDIS